MTLRVGFCGVGRMGTEMVVALARQGFAVTVWNRTAARALAAAEQTGAEVAGTPALAAS